MSHELDLLDNHLELGTVLTVLLPLTEAEFAINGNLVALRHVLGNALGSGAEHSAVDEVRVVLPLVRLTISTAIVDGKSERKDGSAARGHADLRVAGDVAGKHNAIDRHRMFLPLGVYGMPFIPLVSI